jgi:N-acetylglucosaminyldiphosphoundecaprenol N-acetyl-beta-D-mannosaminyltransferase
MSKAYPLEGVNINLSTPAAARAEVLGRARARRGFTLFTFNLDHLAKLLSDEDFRAAYAGAELVSADGWPIVWLARRDGVSLERTCGSDLVEPICEDAARHDLATYFVGPRRIAQSLALRRLGDLYPGLRVAGAEAPQFGARLQDGEVAALADRIRRSGARLCFLCLGAPKQELLADRLSRACPEVGFICVGAALDFISGLSRRAPAWARRLRAEWLWRLASEPKRLFARYAHGGFLFLQLVLSKRISRTEVMI